MTITCKQELNKSYTVTPSDKMEYINMAKQVRARWNSSKNAWIMTPDKYHTFIQIMKILKPDTPTVINIDETQSVEVEDVEPVEVEDVELVEVEDVEPVEVEEVEPVEDSDDELVDEDDELINEYMSMYNSEYLNVSKFLMTSDSEDSLSASDSDASSQDFPNMSPNRDNLAYDKTLDKINTMRGK